MNQSLARAYIGTSGWHFAHWRGPFYPPDMKPGDQLVYYASRFGCVEVNNTFYQLPRLETIQSWREQTPEAFRFAIKASRFVTHMKKLKDPGQSLKPFLERVDAFGSQAGPVLFQLPPRWRCDHQRLAGFLQALPAHHRYAFEFRDRSWINDTTLELLHKHGAAFCIYDLDGYLSPREVTTDLVYVRLHGPGGAYQGKYDTQALAEWAGAVKTWLAGGLEAYVYFDNDQEGFAAKNAQELAAMLE